jgi:hypothetical protein
MVNKMVCDTIRKGKNCLFMKKSCTFPTGKCYPIAEKCGACKNTELFDDVIYCKVYMDPGAIWTTSCGRSTVMAKPIIEEQKKINPLKASKKASGGKMKKKK